MNNLSINLMQTVVEIINEQQKGLKKNDPTRLRLVEIGPKSEDFADSGLSCYICPNDPDDPDGWADEEITEPGRQFNTTSNKSMLELGGGHYFNLRFTIFFTLFYNELGINRKVAFESSRIMLDRIQRAIFEAGLVPNGPFGKLQRADDFGCHLVRSMNAVKKRRLTPAGSEGETFYRGKMWLQFEAYMEGPG
ncbi:MAG: hypothetical protein HS114_28690 [Anaerolineales bacterium]|nr:hypothetical protein [Anaerolineales bacterium]